MKEWNKINKSTKNSHRIFQCRNRRIRPRGRCLHRTVRIRRDQRQPDGTADHDQRVQDCVRFPSDRCDTLLPVRSPGQEGQGRPSHPF